MFVQIGETLENKKQKTVEKMAGDGKRQCANCEVIKDGSELLDCARCRAISYCSKECQVQHWKKGGHKRLCVAMETSNKFFEKKTKSDLTNSGSNSFYETFTSKRGPRLILAVVLFLVLSLLLAKLEQPPFRIDSWRTMVNAEATSSISTTDNKKESLEAYCEESSSISLSSDSQAENHGISEKEKKTNLFTNLFKRFRKNRQHKQVKSETKGFKAWRVSMLEKTRRIREIKPFAPLRNFLGRLRRGDRK